MLALAVLVQEAFAAPATCENHSLPTRVGILELYTSEGCNSCPPADRWVSSLPAKGFTSDRMVALAFHVDYWDQLGWPDRMAKAQYSARQRAQADRNQARVVYTPQLLLNGADFRAANDAGIDDRLKKLNREPALADVALRQNRLSTGVKVDLDVQVAKTAMQSDAQVYLAITENRLDSAIKAGENEGKLLHHDFVVRDLAGPFPVDKSGHLHWQTDAPIRPEWKAADLFLTAFVENTRTGDVLQAMSAPLCVK
ncbi:MAG: DUF1223 domain-containing protein [Betaproteobacteria bacterium]